MDTFLFFLIILLLLGNCKKREPTKELLEEKQIIIKGAYSLYPTFNSKSIFFDANENCKILEVDIIEDCRYKIFHNKLYIYTKNNQIQVFIFNNPDDKILKGIWNNETYFLIKKN